jgi:hypothetical protein
MQKCRIEDSKETPMNSLISNAVARGWISFPHPAAVTAHPDVVKARLNSPDYNAQRAWKLWDQGQSLAYVAKAIGVKKRCVMAIIEEGKSKAKEEK